MFFCFCFKEEQQKHGSQYQWYHFGVGETPILEPILVGIGMFTGGTIWILPHGQDAINNCPIAPDLLLTPKPVLVLSSGFSSSASQSSWAERVERGWGIVSGC